MLPHRQQRSKRPAQEMRAFFIVWLGQLVSLVGSGLTAFALGVWVYERTQSAASFAFIYLFFELPGVLIYPVAGALADRVDRRRMMIAGDTVAGLATLGLALFLLFGRLEVWHVYVGVAVMSLGNALQTPAYLASIPLLVPRDQLGRVNGLMQTAQAMRQVVAPALAGWLLLTIQIQRILLLDGFTFAVALLTLRLVAFPRMEALETTSAAGETPLQLWRRDVAAGWRYTRQHTGLLGLLAAVAIFLFILSIIGVLITPMILTFTTPAVLGLLTSIGGVGMLLGGFVLSAWGGPRQRVLGVLGALGLAGFFLILHGLRPSVWLIAVVAPCFFFTIPFILGLNDVIWQAKTPAARQGRVLAFREMVSRALLPVAYFVAGPLADGVFEPLLAEGGPLAATLGAVIGVGPGRGIALMFLLGGGLIMALAGVGYLYPRLRLLESEMPDAPLVRGEA